MAASYSNYPVDHSRPELGRNLTYGLLDNLGRAIVTGRYENSPFPTEAGLCKQHGVSRTVIREAIKMLGAKGLLSARPRQGTKVQPPASWNLFDTDVLSWLLERNFSLELLLQFSQLRAAIEPEAAALAAQFAGPADLAAISGGLALMEEAEKGLEDPLEADIAFHVAILEASQNPFYAQFRGVVRTALRTSIRFTNRMRDHAASLADHAPVCDAIMARKPEAARGAMRKLITDVLGMIEDAESNDRHLPSWVRPSLSE